MLVGSGVWAIGTGGGGPCFCSKSLFIQVTVECGFEDCFLTEVYSF